MGFSWLGPEVGVAGPSVAASDVSCPVVGVIWLEVGVNRLEFGVDGSSIFPLELGLLESVFFEETIATVNGSGGEKVGGYGKSSRRLASIDSGLLFLEKDSGATTASSDGVKGSLLAILSSSHRGVAGFLAIGLGIWSEFGEDEGGVGLVSEFFGEVGVVNISGILAAVETTNCSISGKFTSGLLFLAPIHVPDELLGKCALGAEYWRTIQDSNIIEKTDKSSLIDYGLIIYYGW